MQRKRLAVLVAVVALATLAGCATGGSPPSSANGTASAPGMTGAETTTSDTSVGANDILALGADVTNDTPAIIVEYNTTTYARVLLVDPSGDVVQSGDVGAKHDVGWLWLSNPRPGNYTVVLKQNGTVVSTDTIQFDGGRVEMVDVSVQWDGNTIETVRATLTNDGDLPVKVTSIRALVGKKEMENTYPGKTWVGPNTNVTVSVSPGYNGIAINSPGTVTVEAIVNLEAGVARGTATRVIDPPNLTITNVSDTWRGAALESVEATIENRGDLPVEATATLENAAHTVSETSVSVSAGERSTVRFSAFGPLTTVSSSGSHTYQVTIRHSSGATSANITETFADPTVSIVSATPSWNNSDLTQLHLTLNKTGRLPVDVDYSILEGGTELIDQDGSLTDTGTHVVTLDDPALSIDAAGNHQFTVAVATTYSHDTTSFSRAFDPATINITSVDPQWRNGVLKWVDVRLVNRGDLAAPLSNVTVFVNQSKAHTFEYMGTPTLEPNTAGVYTLMRTSVFGNYDEPIYRASAGGTKSITVFIGNRNVSDRATVTSSIGALDAQVTSVDVGTYTPYNENETELTDISATLKNTGDIRFTIDAVRILAGNQSATVTRDPISFISPGGEQSVYVSLDSVWVSDTVDTVTVEFLYQGRVIAVSKVELDTS